MILYDDAFEELCGSLQLFSFRFFSVSNSKTAGGISGGIKKNECRKLINLTISCHECVSMSA